MQIELHESVVGGGVVAGGGVAGLQVTEVGFVFNLHLRSVEPSIKLQYSFGST